jgi:hypothetical protein
MWERPDFFPFFGRHALIVSTKGKSPYFIESTLAIDSFPRPKARFRRWLCCENYGLDRPPYLLVVDMSGWKGVDDLVAAAQELPGLHITLLGGDDESIGRLREKVTSRGAKLDFRNIDLRPGKDQPIKGSPGDTIEIIAEFELGNAQEVGLKVRAIPRR